MSAAETFGILKVYANEGDDDPLSICSLTKGENFFCFSEKSNNTTIICSSENNSKNLFSIVINDEDDYNIEDLGKEIGVSRATGVAGTAKRLKSGKVFDLEESKSFFVGNLKCEFFSKFSNEFLTWKKEEEEKELVLRLQEKRFEEEKKLKLAKELEEKQNQEKQENEKKLKEMREKETDAQRLRELEEEIIREAFNESKFTEIQEKKKSEDEKTKKPIGKTLKQKTNEKEKVDLGALKGSKPKNLNFEEDNEDMIIFHRKSKNNQKIDDSNSIIENNNNKDEKSVAFNFLNEAYGKFL